MAHRPWPLHITHCLQVETQASECWILRLNLYKKKRKATKHLPIFFQMFGLWAVLLLSALSVVTPTHHTRRNQGNQSKALIRIYMRAPALMSVHSGHLISFYVTALALDTCYHESFFLLTT